MNRLEKVRALLADEPNDPELRYMLAMEHVSLGEDAAAVGVFHELMTASPDYPPAYHMAARTLQRLGRLREAREILERGIPVARRVGNEHAAGEMMGLLDMLD